MRERFFSGSYLCFPENRHPGRRGSNRRYRQRPPSCLFSQNRTFCHEGEENSRYPAASDPAWRTEDTVRAYSLGRLIGVPVHDRKPYEGWDTLTGQRGDGGSERTPIPSLPTGHCLLPHPGQRQRMNNRLPAVTVGSLIGKPEAGCLFLFILRFSCQTGYDLRPCPIAPVWDVGRFPNPFSAGTSTHLSPVMRIRTIVLMIARNGAWGTSLFRFWRGRGRRNSMISHSEAVQTAKFALHGTLLPARHYAIC